MTGVNSVAGTGFSPSTSVSPVFIIPPLIHTHFIYLPQRLYKISNGRHRSIKHLSRLSWLA